MQKISSSALLASILSCSQHRSPPQEALAPRELHILDQVREASGKQIVSDAQDAEYWLLAKNVANSRIVVGLSQEQIVSRLEQGVPCGAAFNEHTADAMVRWCYSIGQLPPRTAGGTPMLVIDFDSERVCRAVRAVHTQ